MKTLFSLTSLLFLTSFHAISQMSPVELVQHQLEAYNSRDIDEFVKVFHDEVSVWSFDGDTPLISGIENFKLSYASMFEQSPELHCNVVNRTMVNDKILDYEIVTGRKGNSAALHLVMVYEFKDGKIWKCTSIR